TPDRVEELQELVSEKNVSCVLSDPQTRSEWSDLIREGTDAGTALADATGGTLDAGPSQYQGTLINLANAYAACLSGN
ncbi:zinc transporter, partial [Octadecabacter sp.]|nr:zinc transporter [Octadecabacter sp.]